MKLIKLAEGHYIIVDGSNIREGDYYIDATNCIRQVVTSDADYWSRRKEYFKITHSTKIVDYPLIEVLMLHEVQNLIQGYSVEEMADKYADINSQGHSTSYHNLFNPIHEAYLTGFKAHKELTKDKLFTDVDIRVAIAKAWNYSKNDENNLTDCGNKIIQSLHPTEWEVEFDENSKLRLVI